MFLFDGKLCASYWLNENYNYIAVLEVDGWHTHTVVYIDEGYAVYDRCAAFWQLGADLFAVADSAQGSNAALIKCVDPGNFAYWETIYAAPFGMGEEYWAAPWSDITEHLGYLWMVGNTANPLREG
jgi:hypothetical protein